MAETLTHPVTPGWTKQARCSSGEYDIDLWHTPGSRSEEAAKAICRRCDVVTTCRTWALNRPEPHGVWGAMSESERLAVVDRQRHQAARALGTCDQCGLTRYSIANPRRYLPDDGAWNSIHNTPRTSKLCQNCHPADQEENTSD